MTNLNFSKRVITALWADLPISTEYTKNKPTLKEVYTRIHKAHNLDYCLFYVYLLDDIEKFNNPPTFNQIKNNFLGNYSRANVTNFSLAIHVNYLQTANSLQDLYNKFYTLHTKPQTSQPNFIKCINFVCNLPDFTRHKKRGNVKSIFWRVALCFAHKPEQILGDSHSGITIDNIFDMIKIG